MKKIFTILSIICLVWPIHSSASDLANELSGHILLQVENNGEAWYVYPEDNRRYFLGRPADAFQLMRAKGVGISNKDLSAIRPDISYDGKDSDGDGLADALEDALGTDKDKRDSDSDGLDDKREIAEDPDHNEDFAESKAGMIFLQVENNGEAWYVYPEDNKRYFLGRPADAFSIMRSLGLGISNSDLELINKVKGEKLPASSAESENERFDLRKMEKKLHLLINNEREAYGLEPLKWRDEIASVARRHSRNLAEENKTITSMDIICDYPMVHHEGMEFGFYVGDRLRNSGVYDYSKNGENIALVSAGNFMFLSGPSKSNVAKAEECRDRLSDWESDLKEELRREDSQSSKVSMILSEIPKREEQMNKETLATESVKWKYPEEITKEMVDGWMNSPGHRANILDMDFDETGIGVVYVNGYLIGTQVFIKKVECGYFNGPCCDKGGCYRPLACNEDNICQ